MVSQVPDIIITLDCEEYEINLDDWEDTTDWDPWVLKTRLREKKVCLCFETLTFF